MIFIDRRISAFFIRNRKLGNRLVDTAARGMAECARLSPDFCHRRDPRLSRATVAGRQEVQPDENQPRPLNEITPLVRPTSFSALNPERIRANWSLQGSEPKFSPVILGHLTDSGPHLRTTLSVASMHPNGYLREEVIRRLNVVTEGWELKFLLIRLNDWVPEVRARAKPAVLARLRDDYLEDLFQSLPIVLVLEHRRRAELDGLD